MSANAGFIVQSENTTRIALVVGGSRGIGRAIALRLAESGFDIWLGYRSNDEAAHQVRQGVESLGRRCELLKFDVSDGESVKAALEPLAKQTAPFAVVYSAGITRDNLMVWMEPQEWYDVVRTDLDGFYHVVHAVLFGMIRARRGRIVAISSVSGQVGQAGQTNYSAAKAGLIGACKALAREVGKRGIGVNVVAPGLIETDMTEGLDYGQILPLIPLGRIGRPEDVAAVVDFLCGESSEYVHGQVIGVNGGLAMP